MRWNFLTANRLATFAAATALLTGASTATAADVYLKTQSFTYTTEDLTAVPMWTFVECDSAFTNCGTAAVGGPQINLTTSDSLTIHVSNELDVPVSVHIPGQGAQGGAGTPVMFTDGRGRQRVRSFTAEVDAMSAGTPGTGSYTFSNLSAGTFLYQSGTYPSIEVPMGLYGALVVTPATSASCTSGSSAYSDAASCYDSDQVLLFSELDPWLNNAISDAAGVVADFPSTVDYLASYLLVNGSESLDLTGANAAAQDDIVLLRMLNAGLTSHKPQMVGLDMALLAEDGFRYPGDTVREQASVLLPAGKTMDVLVDTPALDVTFSLFDRMSRSEFGHQGAGGLIASMDVGAGTSVSTPTVYTIDDVYTEATGLVEGSSSPTQLSVLNNDIGFTGSAVVTVAQQPSNGAISMNTDGTFVYTPSPDFEGGADGFAYLVSEAGSTYLGHVALQVGFVNDAPIARDDFYKNSFGNGLIVDAAAGLYANDSDPDGDLAVAGFPVGGMPAGLAVNWFDGSFVYNPPTTPSTETFTYLMFDMNFAFSNVATVTLEVNPQGNVALTVHDEAGTAITDFSWVVQEDLTFFHDPANPQPTSETLATNFHKSHMPLVAAGDGAAQFAEVALDPEKRHYVSILPGDGGLAGHTMGGAQLLPGMTAVDVLSKTQPIGTAQISVQVFQDLAPTNGVPDAGEPPLGGWQIIVEDAGGRYGAAAGTQLQDAFGNNLKNSLDCFGGAEPPAGVILSCPDGNVLIKDLAPGKYGISVVPPAGIEGTWTQTSTIEGSPLIDAWVKANEPPFFIEFGGAQVHAFFGFVNPELTTIDIPGSNTIRGEVTLLHDPRPPAQVGSVATGSWAAMGHTTPWIGLNSIAGDGPNIQTVQAEIDENTAEATFELTGIPDGTYQIVIWDEFLDVIIEFQTVTVAGGGVEDVGEIPVNAWFTRVENNVYLDANEDGVFDDGEAPLIEQAVLFRWRDGTVYQEFPTDLDGFVPFDEMFPFFNWLVAEIDYARFKPTGLTVRVDNGGVADALGYEDIMSLQEGSPRTETGLVLTQGVLGFPGQTQVLDWGKVPWPEGENGGISGIVYYASTRAESDPRLTAAEPWESGVPGATVRLYKEVDTADGFGALVLVDETTTDDWDNSLPENCPGEDDAAYIAEILGGDATRCYDGWHNWNQAQPAIFDGGYAFDGIEPGRYIVEVVPPAGYELVQEEDVNVAFGDVFSLAAAAAVMPGGGAAAIMPGQEHVERYMEQWGITAAPCVGELREVPGILSMFPTANEPAPFGGEMRPLCDRKEVHLSDQGQAAADFFLFTKTPLASQFTGLTTDDLTIEPALVSPNAGEKWSPSYIPISIRDYEGNELYRGYTDTYGKYNGMVSSTFTANLPAPSGFSPAMHSICLNDFGDLPEGDPYRDADYGTLCYTFQFMPRVTTYLDTPVLPQSAFAAGDSPVDCDQMDGTPEVARVNAIRRNPGQRLTIWSNRDVEVPNPAYEGPTADAPWNEKTITRDHGFGTTAGLVALNGIPLAASATANPWNNNRIQVDIPAGMPPGDYQLQITRGDNGLEALNTVTITIGASRIRRVGANRPFQTIQSAIDAARPGDIVWVDPGIYEENVVMWKPVRLQGSGAGATIINGVRRPTETLVDWVNLVAGRIRAGDVELLPGQAAAFAGDIEAMLLADAAAGVSVYASRTSFDEYASRIDGFTITNSTGGSGIFVNGWADNLQISNNVVTRNSGVLAGGVRVGVPAIPTVGAGPFAFNSGLNMHHNAITRNGATSEQGAGGGVALFTGSDNYAVTDNLICGNFTTGDGGGVGHYGKSDIGVIANNDVLFNQSVNGELLRSGGGIFVGGLAPLGETDLTIGSGRVLIDGNRVQGNQAAAGHGGGIRAEYVNGQDIQANPFNLNAWNFVIMTNNIVVNNVAGWSGAGVAMQDVALSIVEHNTIMNNDSTATQSGLVVPAGTSPAQIAGFASAPHSAPLAATMPFFGTLNQFSNPLVFARNIIFHNRSFQYQELGAAGLLLPELAPAFVGDCEGGDPVYDDVGVLGGAFTITPILSITTDGLGPFNSAADPTVMNEYCNGARALSTPGPMAVSAGFEEGGNATSVFYGPITQVWPQDGSAAAWDYHLQAGSPAIGYFPPTSSFATTVDIDGDARTFPVDLGADEN